LSKIEFSLIEKPEKRICTGGFKSEKVPLLSIGAITPKLSKNV